MEEHVALNHCGQEKRTSLAAWRPGRWLAATSIAAFGMAIPQAPALAAPVPTPSTLVSVCSGVALPRSVVTDIMDPVVTGIYDPIETVVNDTLGLLVIPGLPAPLSVDVSGLLTSAASGSDVSLSVLSADGTLVGPSDQCDATADSYSLDNPAGIAIGGNQITGLGDPGEQAVAGEINSVAIGNRASTDATSANSIALGPDATVDVNSDGSIAFGSNASVSEANSVALGADSVADRGAVTGVSVGEISVGSPGNERQITNVAVGTQPTDAVNVAQLNAALAGVGSGPDVVIYDDSSHGSVTLDGTDGTTVTGVADGTLSPTSTDAVNGSQLYATNQQVDANTQAIADLQAGGGGGTGSGSSEPVPIAYSDADSPTTPNSGTVTNDATLVGATSDPVALHNVANGEIAEGSTDAVNGGQIYGLSLDVQNAVTYDDSTHTSVTLNDGGSAVAIHNVAAGTAPTDAANVGQVNDAMDNAIATANAYTDSRLDALDFDVRRARRDADAGTAAALAAAGMPQAMDAGRTMVMGGFGFYRNRVGFAVGASYRADDGGSVYRVGVTYDSSQHVGANAGVGFEF